MTYDQAVLWWYPFIAGSAVTVTIIVIGVATAAVRAAWKMVLASEARAIEVEAKIERFFAATGWDKETLESFLASAGWNKGSDDV